MESVVLSSFDFMGCCSTVVVGARIPICLGEISLAMPRSRDPSFISAAWEVSNFGLGGSYGDACRSVVITEAVGVNGTVEVDAVGGPDDSESTDGVGAAGVRPPGLRRRGIFGANCFLFLSIHKLCEGS